MPSDICFDGPSGFAAFSPIEPTIPCRAYLPCLELKDHSAWKALPLKRSEHEQGPKSGDCGSPTSILLLHRVLLPFDADDG